MLRRELRELRDIAGTIDDHAKHGRPYKLTFYNSDEHVTEPITRTQREELEKYLAYSFHEIWANTWLHIQSDRIRQVIGDSPKHS